MPAAAGRWVNPAPTDSRGAGGLAAASSAASASSWPMARSASQASSPSGGPVSGSGQQPASSASVGSGGGSQPASPGNTSTPAASRPPSGPRRRAGWLVWHRRLLRRMWETLRCEYTIVYPRKMATDSNRILISRSGRSGRSARLAGGRAFLGQRDHADCLGGRHAEVSGELPGRLPLRIGQGAVSQPDPYDLGEEPLPGGDGELGRERVQPLGDGPAAARTGGLQVGGRQIGQLQIGVDRGGVVAGDTGALDRVDDPAAGRAAAGVAGLEHRDRGRPHPGGQRLLHLRQGRQREHAGAVPGAALRALDMLARLVERDHRNEEQVDPAPARLVPVGPVSAAPLAVEGSLADATEVDPQPEDQEHPAPPAGTSVRYRPYLANQTTAIITRANRGSRPNGSSSAGTRACGAASLPPRPGCGTASLRPGDPAPREVPWPTANRPGQLPRRAR